MMQSSTPTALVTGAAGFIGSHIAEKLCNLGAKVFGIDNLSYGNIENLSWANKGNRFEFIRADAGDEDALAKILPECEWVFHEAAVASVPWSVEHPVASHENNLTVTVKLLEAARKAGVKRFVFASSSSIYGDGPEQPKTESMPPAPLTPYALQKLTSERYLELFYRLYGLETVSLRYFNVFGPRQRDDSPYSGVIAKFTADLRHGRNPVIFGDGLQTRDYVYIDNVVQANILAATSPVETVAGHAFNVGCGESVSLLDLVHAISTTLQKPITPILSPPRPGDILHSCADISKLQAATHYCPFVSWKDGLKRTMADK